MDERRLLLAPGASGNVDRIRPMLSALLARGVDAQPVALPRGSAERALPAWRAALAAEAVCIGGQSFGGRVASLLAAEAEVAVPGLVLMCFPLHAPGRPEHATERTTERTTHFARIHCPVLLLSGEADPFAQLPLLRRAVALLPNAELVTYPNVGHSLLPVLDDAADRIVAFIGRVTATAL